MNKIIGICGSPRKGGNSEWALERVLDACERNGASTEMVLLSTAYVKMCTGCLMCEDDNVCPLVDDMGVIYEQIKASEILVFSSPAYFDNVPGGLKNLMDRTNLIFSALKGKKAAIVIVGQANESSWMAASKAIEAYCDLCEISVIGQVFGKARELGDLSRDAEAAQRLDDLAAMIMQ